MGHGEWDLGLGTWDLGRWGALILRQSRRVEVRLKHRLIRSIPALLLLACGHSDNFEIPVTQALGPSSAGADVQLTFNADQDYWPAWTQDGKGILYSFVNPGSTAGHRCLGIMPAAGGSRLWEMCDNRAIRRDSVSSYTAYALDSTGKLLVVEALSRTGFASVFPFHIRLILTDTAAPYVRTVLDTLPKVGDSIGSTVAVSWMSELRWTGPNTFVALGQQYGTAGAPPCGSPFPCQDSTFANNGIVLRGTISGGHATFAAIAGTEGAVGYSLADNGATVVFIRLGPAQLLRVPIGGGGATIAGVASSEAGASLLGVTCHGTTCLAAATFPTKPSALISVSLTTGQAQVVKTISTSLLATPIGSPSNGDVVVQIGGVRGHIATVANNPGSNLFLYKGIFP